MRTRAMAGFSLAILLTGCARAPAFNVLGSLFPGWIACIVAAIVLTVLVRLVLARLDWERRIRALPLAYASFALLLACSLWLLFFE